MDKICANISKKRDGVKCAPIQNIGSFKLYSFANQTDRTKHGKLGGTRDDTKN